MNPDSRTSVPPLPAVPSNVVPFASLRLTHPMAAHVLIEYEDRPGGRQYREVSLTCSAESASGLIYFGGYAAGKFSIFRADCIHHVVQLPNKA